MGPEPARGVKPELIRKRVVVKIDESLLLVDDNFSGAGPPMDFDWRQPLVEAMDIRVILWYYSPTGRILVLSGAPEVVDLDSKGAPVVG